MIMVSMAAYGSLGAAMSGGAQLALERRSGWFRQLNITALPAQIFLLAKSAVIMVVVLPALILVFVAGFVVGGVRAPATAWLASLALMWLALLPMTILGVAIGLWAGADAVPGVTTLVLLMLSALGGLWFPVQIMPDVMQTIAKTLPSYWLAELGRWPFLPGTGFPWAGIAVLLGWSIGLTVLGALGYRRAGERHAVTSPRAGEDRMASSAFTRFFHPAPFDTYEDPRAAPGAYKGPSMADPWTLRRGGRTCSGPTCAGWSS